MNKALISADFINIRTQIHYKITINAYLRNGLKLFKNIFKLSPIIEIQSTQNINIQFILVLSKYN